MGFKKKTAARKPRPPKDDKSTLKIRLRGRDNAPLSMQEYCEATLEAARRLKQYENGYRIKSASIFLTMVDDNGAPVRINAANELVIYAYRSAADEAGL